jgi:hypothetical protein
VTRSREWLAGGVLAAGGVIFALLMLEVGVRWLHLPPDRFWEPDAVLGARLIPGKSGWWTQEEREFVVPIRINDHGLRDVEHSYDKPAGVRRVLILGDSFVEAMHVPLEDTFARRLQHDLDPSSERIEIISAGCSGYGTAGAVLFFEQRGVRYRPDLVLLAFYPGNDVGNNSSTIEETLPPLYGTDGRLEKVVGAPSSDVQRREGLLSRSAAYRYVRKLVLTRQPSVAEVLTEVGLMQPQAVRKPPERDGIPVAYGVYADPLSEEWENAWNTTEGLLARLKQAVEAAGARLAIAILTTRERIYPDSWEQILAQHPEMRQRTWDLGAPQRRVKRWCTDHGVPCLDLETAFARAREQSVEDLHFPRDGHWTSAGHQLAAAELKTFIERRQLLPSH